MSHIESVFNNVKSRNKIYCIEASALTHSILPHFKNHIINMLKAQSHHGDSRKFNVICFNSDVAKWCVSVVPCNSENITAAEDWLRHIQPEGTCNFLGAIVSALRETTSTSLCFIVTQKPNQDVDEILDLFAFIGRKIQIHIRLCLLSNDFSNELQEAIDIFSQIATETFGSFALVKLNNNNDLYIMQSTKNIINLSDSVVLSSSLNSSDEEIENIKKLEIMRDTEKKELLGRQHWDVSFPGMWQRTVGNETEYKPFDIWKRVSASKSYLECMQRFNQSNFAQMSQNNVSDVAADMIIGRQVLARKYTTGQYYVGHVKEKINNELFNIVFGPYDWGRGQFIAKDFQQTKLYDLIDFGDAIKRSVIPGDRVLAPDPTSNVKDIHLCRFLTGTVLSGSILREYALGKSPLMDLLNEKPSDTPLQTSPYLIIEFTHPLNKTEKVLSDKVIYIPEPFFQRLCLEGAMPKSAREKLFSIPNYPMSSLPGYPTSGSKKTPIDYTFTNLNVIKSRTLQVDYLMPPYCLPLYPVVEIFEKDDRTDNLMSKSDWASESYVKKSKFFKKDDTRVPDSIYTVNELDLKVKDQLETFKELLQSKSMDDKSFFRGNPSRSTDNDSRSAKTLHIKPSEKLARAVSFKQHQSTSPFDGISEEEPKMINKNFSIHEEYFDELRKIRATGRMEEESYSSSIFESPRVDRRSINLEKTSKENGFIRPQILFNNKYSESNKKDFYNSNVVYITDLGQNDKERESRENQKLRTRQNQVARRLEKEKHQFYNEERAKDRKLEFKRQKSAERNRQENPLFQREEAAVDKVQKIKRVVLSEVENKVETVKPVPQTHEEIDARRIAQLRERMEQRNSVKFKRDEEALKYIEKIEMNQRQRNSARWLESQNKMLKEFSE